MKIAVCIATDGADAFGYLRRYAQQFSAAAKARGVEVEILCHPDASFYPRLFENLADERCIVHFYGYLFEPSSDADACFIDRSRAITVVSIGDHPFATFMRRTVQNARPRTRFIVLEESFRDELSTLNPALAAARYDYQPIPPPVNYDVGNVTDFENRPFDLVVPMFMVDLDGQDMTVLRSRLTAPWFEKIIMDTYECARSNLEQNPFHVLRDFMQARVGLTLAELRDRNPVVFGQLLLTISGVDSIVRQERRQEMVNALLRETGGLRVAVTSNPFKGLQVDRNVEFVGMRPVAHVAKLMAASRAVLNCNPSYPSSLHERIVSGMMYGSCVITDVNSYIDSCFAENEFVAYAPGSPMTIADIFEARDVESVAAAGARKIRADPSYSWNGHIDRLMHAALC